jgi:hypothetical protein
MSKPLLLDILAVVGKKVFVELEENIKLLDDFQKRFILLLMDFDDEDKDSEISFNKRMKKLDSIVPSRHKDRVFLLGVNHKESEALKKHFVKSDFEEIGKILLEDCPDSDLTKWKNIHLKCNLSEIQRMKDCGIFEWLFK